MAENRICPSCGARNKESESQCSLCGTDLSLTESELEGRVVTGDRQSEHKFCASCGEALPQDQRIEVKFCPSCGKPLPEPLSRTAPVRPPTDDGPATDVDEAKVLGRVSAYLAGGVLLVVGLFAITVWSQGRSAASTTITPPVAQQTPSEVPLPDALQSRVDQMQSELDALDDPMMKAAKHIELAEAYLEGDRLDLAAAEREQVALLQETATAWTKTGDLYYDWMERLQQRNESPTAFAKKAIAAYSRSLEIDPSNVNVRTDMAVAYLNDPDNPMMAIQETNKVLEEAPDHPQANFNKAVMLLFVGRSQEAIQQYARVLEITEPGTRIYEEAKLRLQRLRNEAS